MQFKERYKVENGSPVSPLLPRGNKNNEEENSSPTAQMQQHPSKKLHPQQQQQQQHPPQQHFPRQHEPSDTDPLSLKLDEKLDSILENNQRDESTTNLKVEAETGEKDANAGKTGRPRKNPVVLITSEPDEEKQTQSRDDKKQRDKSGGGGGSKSDVSLTRYSREANLMSANIQIVEAAENENAVSAPSGNSNSGLPTPTEYEEV